MDPKLDKTLDQALQEPPTFTSEDSKIVINTSVQIVNETIDLDELKESIDRLTLSIANNQEHLARLQDKYTSAKTALNLQ